MKETFAFAGAGAAAALTWFAIHFGDDEKWAEYHPPAKWEQVSAEPDHLAGLNTPYVDEDDDDEDEDEDEDEDDEDYVDDEDYQED